MNKRPYVLIHGCFKGGWIWKPVADRLNAAGHAVYHPSLDGCGERSGAVRPGITIGAQAREMAQLLFMEDLRDVHLVATSNGGNVAMTAAAFARDRIARITFVDAVVLFPGERLRDNWPDRPDMEELFGSGVSVPIIRGGADYGVSPDLAAWENERSTPQPAATMTGVMEDCGFWRHEWPATVICCKRSENPGERHQRRAAERLKAKWLEIDTGHLPFLSAPDELTSMLLE